MRKLLFVANNLDVGGPQKGLVALLEALDPTRFECTVVSLQRGGELRPYIEERATVLDVPDVAHAAQINKHDVPGDLRTLLSSRQLMAVALYLVAVFMRIFRKPMNPWRQRLWHSVSDTMPVLEGSFDAAFAVSSGLATYYAVDCVDARNKYHWVIGDYSRTAIDRDVDLSYFRRTTGGLAVSQECADIFWDVFPELEDHPLTPFHQLIPWKFYESQAGEAVEFTDVQELKVLSVSRLDPDKGLELAAAAAKVLRDRGVGVRWVVLGDGSFRPELEHLIAEHGVQESFVLAGFKNNVMDYIREADVFVHPSRSEGRSSAVDEALASGKAVVLTNYRTAASQVVHGETGLICEMTPEGIADSVASLVDEESRAAISHVSRRDSIVTDDFFEELCRARVS